MSPDSPARCRLSALARLLRTWCWCDGWMWWRDRYGLALKVASALGQRLIADQLDVPHTTLRRVARSRRGHHVARQCLRWPWSGRTTSKSTP